MSYESPISILVNEDGNIVNSDGDVVPNSLFTNKSGLPSKGKLGRIEDSMDKLVDSTGASLQIDGEDVYVDENGFPYLEAQTPLQIISNCLKRTGLKLDLWGINPYEVTHFKAGFLGIAPDFESKNVFTTGIFKQLNYIKWN